MAELLKIFPRYTELGASSRCRYYHYRAAFEASGYRCVFLPFFPTAYLKEFYRGEGKSLWLFLFALLRRFCRVFFLRGTVLIEYELLPFVPYGVERLFLRHCRYILNFDDNVWEKYKSSALLRDKFDELCRHAAGVIAANDFLLEKIRPLNPRVVKIPTAVRLGSAPVPSVKHAVFSIVWIGTPVTYAYLEKSSGIWRSLARRFEYELVVIARRNLESRALPGVPMRFCDWSEATEQKELGAADVGVMPLTDDAFSRGKSAFKLIQYAAAGLPSVASDVGENANVVEHGVTGFLCGVDADFIEALQTLHDDAILRRNMGRAAFEKAREFSIEKFAPVYTGFLRG